MPPVTLDKPVVLGMFVVVFFDLGIRYLVFRRLESIAVDVAIFSAVYSGVEWFRLSLDPGSGSQSAGSDQKDWPIRTVIALVCLGILAAVHRDAQEDVNKSIRRTLHHIEHSSRDEPSVVSGSAQQMDKRWEDFGEIVERSVPLTFSGPEYPRWLRGGKREWREQVSSTLGWLFPQVPVEQTELLLGARRRFVLAMLFAAVGLVALVSPAIHIGV